MRFARTILVLATALFAFCCSPTGKEVRSIRSLAGEGQMLVVLGVAQDAGYPQAGCTRSCCEAYWDGKEDKRHVASIGIVDYEQGKTWLFDATPDIREQMQHLKEFSYGSELAGVFLTHAHIGHYTGLMHFGREVMGTQNMPVYAMPKMTRYLSENGPWSQLVTLSNIELRTLRADSVIRIGDHIEVTPFLVPHRDEYSETVGYKIKGEHKSVLFIPDINKWGAWERNIIAEVEQVDFAFIDGSFYKNGEIPGRDMRDIPHPFIEESMQLFSEMSPMAKSKVHFIHFNHTNPVFRDTPEHDAVLGDVFNIAWEGLSVVL